jgi:hypothetical protein
VASRQRVRIVCMYVCTVRTTCHITHVTPHVLIVIHITCSIHVLIAITLPLSWPYREDNITGREGLEGEWRYSSTLSLTEALDECKR